MVAAFAGIISGKFLLDKLDPKKIIEKKRGSRQDGLVAAFAGIHLDRQADFC